MMSDRPVIASPCHHIACHSCWQQWLSKQIEENNNHFGPLFNIKCPYCRSDLTEYPEFLEGDNDFELGRDYYERMYPDFVRR